MNILSPKILLPTNVNKVKTIHLVGTIICCLLTVYLMYSSVVGFKDIIKANAAIIQEKTHMSKLRNEFTILEKKQKNSLPTLDTRVEDFAVYLEKWAREKNIKIDSFAPEGSSTVIEVTQSESKFGKFAVSKVKIQGKAEYEMLFELFREFELCRIPVEIESISLKSSSDTNQSVVDFDLIVKVFEKKAGDT
ncbi:MAG: hypothetical protein SNJ70_07700 [Armatimonadota bacterium]